MVRLADALAVTDAERRSLREAADRAPHRTPRVPAAIASVPERIATPAYCLGRYGDAWARNPQAEALCPDWLGPEGQERNRLRVMFCIPVARDFAVDWPQRVPSGRGVFHGRRRPCRRGAA